MTITITNVGNGFYRIKATHKEFKKNYGNGITTKEKYLFNVMDKLTTWGNNELKEAVLFEIG